MIPTKSSGTEPTLPKFRRIVINGDAEQVIVASMKDGVIKYTSGSIENPTIQDKAIVILEGGEQAFRQRQDKYRLN